MDADTIRLILFLAGLVLILGIYFWDKRRKLDTRIHAIRRAQEKVEPEIDTDLDPMDQEEGIASDSLGVLAEDPFESMQSEDDEDLHSAEELQPLDDVITEEIVADPVVETTTEQTAFSFAAVDEEEVMEALGDDLPTKILQLNIVTNNAPMASAEIHKVAQEVGLAFGEMSIFHRHLDGSGSPVIFSMASMVEPGTFPADPSTEFTTPGLALFARLPGPQDGLAVFSDMLYTAERMAAVLDGSLQDETHSDLTKQTIEHVREEILEHRRQIQLAKTRIQ